MADLPSLPPISLKKPLKKKGAGRGGAPPPSSRVPMQPPMLPLKRA